MTAPWALAETSALRPPGALRTDSGAPDRPESLAAQMAEAARTSLTALSR
ncbi:hypothetical protein WMF45_34155 [Sorangium sp. So ce448]